MNNVKDHTDESSFITKLPNGLTVALEPLSHLCSVSVGIWIKTGSVNEECEKAGVSHFLEHLFFKGTKKRTTRQIMEAIEARGGHLNAFTSREVTCLYARVLDSHLHTAIEVLADIFKNSTFRDLDKERNVILEEIASAMDVPEDYAHDLLAERMWPAHSLGRPVSGSIESVSALDLEDIRNHFDTWYKPENVVISVAGNFQPDEVLKQLTDEFAALEQAAVPVQPGPPNFNHCIERVTRDIAQDHICVAFPGPKVGDEQRYAYDVLNSVLGGGSISRLFEKIREEEGLAYSIYTYNSAYLRSGMFGMYAAVAPENLGKTVELAFEEFRKMRDEPIGDNELDINREQLKGGLLMALENTFNRMARMARSIIYYGRIKSIEEIIQNIDSVGADDIQKVSQDIFQADKCAFVVLGNGNGNDPEKLPL